MNVFKNYSILLIAIFILSFRTLNASSDEESGVEDPEVEDLEVEDLKIKDSEVEESEEEGSEAIQINIPPYYGNQELITTCVRSITSVFEGDDLHQQAQIAIHRFSVRIYRDFLINKFADQRAAPDHDLLNRCTYSIDENNAREYTGDVLAYYFSFNKYLLIGQIPDSQTFCNRINVLLEHPGECLERLNNFYTDNGDKALKVAFYKYRLGTIPVIPLKIVEPINEKEAHQQYQCIKANRLRTYVEAIGEEIRIDISLAYFDLIKSTFELQTHSENNRVGNRMLNPLEFCIRRWGYIIRIYD